MHCYRGLVTVLLVAANFFFSLLLTPVPNVANITRKAGPSNPASASVMLPGSLPE